MIEAGAVVERLEGEDAWVRVQERSGGCGRCDEPGGCRSSGIAYAFKAPKTLFRVPNRIGARIGDVVQLRMEDGAALRGAMLSYGLGVALLVIGAAVGHAVAPTELADAGAAAGAVAGMIAALLANRVLVRSTRLRARFGIQMVFAANCAHHPSVQS